MRATLAAAVILVAICAVLGMRSRDLDAAWRVDEGQRIAEGYVWRLLRAGDVAHPDFFRTIAFRSHPQISKFFYGAAVEMAGVPPPRDMRLALRYDAGAGAATMPDEHAAEYLPMRRPARLASFFANVLTAAILFVVLMRAHGIAVALLSQLLLFRHYLFASALFYARSDTVQTFLTTATLAPLVFLPARSGAAVAAVFAALAFQTRVNGAVALLMCLAFLIVRAPRERQTWIAVAILVVVFGIAGVAANPYYWAEPRAAVGIPESILAEEILPMRVLHRAQLQLTELRQLLGGVDAQWHIPSIGGRIAFTARSLFSGLSGLLIAAGILLALLTLRAASPRERATIAWALTGIVAIAAWMPLRWDYYLLLIVPPAVVAASTGYAAALRRVMAWRARGVAGAQM